MINGLKFEYDGIAGNAEISGPVLTFSVKFSYNGLPNQESTLYFGIRGAYLLTLVDKIDMKVGPLSPESFHIEPVGKGGTTTLKFELRHQSASLQELTMIAKERVFSIRIDLFGYEVPVGSRINNLDLMGLILFSPQTTSVQGKVNGAENTMHFQIPIESWLEALKESGVMDYYINTLVVNSDGRKDIRDLVQKIHEARDLLIQGKPGDSIAKLRDIVTWAGYKRKEEKNRYEKLKDYSLTANERADLVAPLDTLWRWTARGHHQGLNSDEVNEDQAKETIDLCYVFVSLLSRRKTSSTL